MKFSKKLEKADIELEEQRKSPHKTSSYEEVINKSSFNLILVVFEV